MATAKSTTPITSPKVTAARAELQAHGARAYVEAREAHFDVTRLLADVLAVPVVECYSCGSVLNADGLCRCVVPLQD